VTYRSAHSRRIGTRVAEARLYGESIWASLANALAGSAARARGTWRASRPRKREGRAGAGSLCPPSPPAAAVHSRPFAALALFRRAVRRPRASFLHGEGASSLPRGSRRTLSQPLRPSSELRWARHAPPAGAAPALAAYARGL
jgi:hypothetical protein